MLTAVRAAAPRSRFRWPPAGAAAGLAGAGWPVRGRAGVAGEGAVADAAGSLGAGSCGRRRSCGAAVPLAWPASVGAAALADPLAPLVPLAAGGAVVALPLLSASGASSPWPPDR